MVKTFSAILDLHEHDDKRQAEKEALIITAIKKEFANGKAILKLAQSLSLSVQDLIEGKISGFPIIPIRQSDKFYIKKHTLSQTPYFHSHEFYELIYVHRGQCEQSFKDGTKIHLTQRQCLLIPPGAVHLIEKCNPNDIILKLVIPCSIFEDTASKILGGMPDKVIMFDNVSATAEFAVLKLLEEELRVYEYKDLVTNSYLTIIFSQLAGCGSNGIAITTLLSSYFEKNVKTASLSEFAKMRNYNPDYASRLIKNQTGKSFSHLLSSYRIELAKRLLTDSALSIEDIAEEVGYSNASGLYKQFFLLLGMTPSAYRKLLK